MFSLSNYKVLIESAVKNGYKVRPLSSFNGDTGGATLLLRHDVDYSPSMALKVGELNAKAGVSATFFFLMDSPLYNLCTAESQMVLGRLKELEQEVGYHVSFTPGVTNRESLIAGWELFKKIVPTAVPVMAWHNPNTELLGEANDTARATELLRSAYDEPFMSEDIKYLSDSNRRNGFKDLMSLLNPDKTPVVQLLLHPLNWVLGGDSMPEILLGAWDEISKSLDEEFSSNSNWKRRKL